MQELSTIGAELLNQMCGDAGRAEGRTIAALLEGLPQEQAFEIDRAVGDYGAEMLAAGFLAGLAAGVTRWPGWWKDRRKFVLCYLSFAGDGSIIAST